MSKIQISDIKLDGSELFNDSENFLSDLKDSEIDEIVGGLSLAKESFDKELIQADLDDKAYTTTVYFPKEPICYYPIKPICEIKPPIHPIKPIFFYPCPVIL